MREYDKMTLKVAERIFEKGDKFLEQRQKKAAKIRHITYAVSGLCAAVLVCFGIWKTMPSFNKTDIIIKDTDSVITTATTIFEGSVSETSVLNTTSVQTKNTVTAEKSTVATTNTEITTSVTSSKTALNPTTQNNVTIQTMTRLTQITSSTHTTVNHISTSTTVWSGEEIAYMTTTHDCKTVIETVVEEDNTHGVETISKTTACAVETLVTTRVTTDNALTTTTGSKQIENPTSTSLALNPVTTFIVSSSFTNPIITTTTINIQENFHSYPCSFRYNNEQYIKEGTSVETGNIGDYIRKVPVNINVPNLLIIERMEAYEICDISIEEAIAVKLKNTDEYYLFRNIYYKKDDDIS